MDYDRLVLTNPANVAFVLGLQPFDQFANEARARNAEHNSGRRFAHEIIGADRQSGRSTRLLCQRIAQLVDQRSLVLEFPLGHAGMPVPHTDNMALHDKRRFERMLADLGVRTLQRREAARTYLYEVVR